jgi:DNA modification methylase
MKAVGRHLPGNKTHKGTTAYEAGDEYHRTKGGLVAYSERQRKLADAASGTKNNTSFDAAMAIMPEKRNRRSVWEVTTQPFSEAHFATFPPQLIEPCILAGCPEGGTVLDPFFGAGTTGLVADRLGRNCIGIELNPEYAEMAQRRIEGDAPMFANVEAA